ncbi:MAG: ferredoxin [Nanoarchaeota archaeon]|nr:ferredoxin [Nanoarchaeota archaeon]
MGEENQKYKIIHDRDICIGCSACASVCPKYWEMNSDGKSDVIGSEKTGNGEEEKLGPINVDYSCNKEAADSCPVNCIHIFKIKEDESEEKII